MPPRGYVEVARVKLFGDWNLKIKFSYVVKGLSAANQKVGSMVPAALRQQQPQLGLPAPTDLGSLLNRARKVFEMFPYDILPLDTVRAKLREHKMNFIDIEFPPVDSSIYAPHEPDNPFAETTIVWKRPHEFMEVDPSKDELAIDVFYKKVEPDDIKQGQLGDCWFMCALASLAERPYLVERLFIT